MAIWELQIQILMANYIKKNKKDEIYKILAEKIEEICASHISRLYDLLIIS